MPSAKADDARSVAIAKRAEELETKAPKPSDTRLTKHEFVGKADPQEFSLFGHEFEAKPVIFNNSGNVGFRATGYFQLKGSQMAANQTQHSIPYTMRAQCNFYVPDSKTWKTGKKEENSEDADDSDEEGSDSDDVFHAAKRIKTEVNQNMYHGVWVEDAPDLKFEIFGKKISVQAKWNKEKNTAGYFCDREFEVEVDGEEFVLKASMSVKVCGAKKWRKSGIPKVPMSK